MSTFDYSSIYATAVRLITKFGAEFTHQQVDTSYTKSYDTTTSKDIWTNAAGTVVTTAPYTTDTANGVVVGFSQEERYNTAIQQGDKKLLTVTIETPTSADIYTIGTTDYSYVNHETIQPDSSSSPILYKIQVRV